MLEFLKTNPVPVAELVTSTLMAAVVAYVAYQQYRTNRTRLESELRERMWRRQRALYVRRWKVYMGVRKYLDGDDGSPGAGGYAACNGRPPAATVGSGANL